MVHEYGALHGDQLGHVADVMAPSMQKEKIQVPHQYLHQRANVDDILYGHDLEGPAFVRGFDKTAAGKPSTLMNSSFSAYDYKPSHLDGQRSFMMDDYLQSGRFARSKPASGGDSCWELLHYKAEPQFKPVQGFSETKFHNGFMRRQQSSILQDQQRLENEVHKEQRAERVMTQRRQRLGALESFAYNGYDVITGQEIDPSRNRGPHKERRHVADHVADRSSMVGADTSGGRLRDSTSRFFCTSDQLPHRAGRCHNITNDGLTVTQRTSTMIGVGPNPAQEIHSTGASEALSNSLYGLKRRAVVGRRSTPSAEDVALVRSLK